MTAAGHHVVNAFEALKPEDQRQVAIEIFRRCAMHEELSFVELDGLASEVFRCYDREETRNAAPE